MQTKPTHDDRTETPRCYRTESKTRLLKHGRQIDDELLRCLVERYNLSNGCNRGGGE